jgi:transcriptional regulator with XRE-family HTH domain
MIRRFHGGSGTKGCCSRSAGLQHLVDIEHGRTNPTVTSLVGIARALGVKIRDIFEGV